MPQRKHRNGAHPEALIRDRPHVCAAEMTEDDVLKGLHAINELRRLIDLHEERLVRLGLERKLSWYKMSISAGVSRQSLHQKWARRIQGDPRPIPKPAGMRPRRRWILDEGEWRPRDGRGDV